MWHEVLSSLCGSVVFLVGNMGMVGSVAVCLVSTNMLYLVTELSRP